MFYEEHIDSVRVALDTFDYDYVLCRHDHDLDKDGNSKQPHYHMVVIFPTPQFQFTLAKRLGLENRFVKPPKSDKPNGAVRYLLHLDNPEKYQYGEDVLETNLDEDTLAGYMVKLESNSNKSKDEETENVLQDIEDLACNRIGYKAFLRNHPSFIYQASSLMKLVELAADWRWNGVDESGEIKVT